ncbi:MAG: MarR family transcriptional regulator [Planctomycetales bacterium]|nr:MarR family transcriptional regulator [Planctomycetales bacterium]
MPPFASVQREALLNLLRTGDQLENRLMRFFRKHDLTLSQFNLLRVLQLEQRALNCSEIGERMIQIVPAITGLVDRLEQRQLVQRHRCSSDRRVVYVSITPQGAALTEQALGPLGQLEQQLFQRLSADELQSLIRLLEATRESMAADDETQESCP